MKWQTIDRCRIAEISTLGTFRFKEQKTANGILPQRDIEVKNGSVTLPIIMRDNKTVFLPCNALEIMVRHYLGKNISFRKVSFKDRDKTNIGINNLIY